MGPALNYHLFPQRVLKAACDSETHPLSSPHQLEIQRQKTQSSLICAECGLHAEQEHIDTLYAEVEKKLPQDKGSVKARAALIEACFVASPRNGDFTVPEAGQYDLLCRACFISRFAFHPACTAFGAYGRVLSMSQQDITLQWRYVRQAQLASLPGAGNLYDGLRIFYQGAKTGLMTSLQRPMGDFSLSPTGLTYWLANCDPAIFEKIPQMIPDLRFLPSLDPSTYLFFITLCQRIDPVERTDQPVAA